MAYIYHKLETKPRDSEPCPKIAEVEVNVNPTLRNQVFIGVCMKEGLPPVIAMHQAGSCHDTAGVREQHLRSSVVPRHQGRAGQWHRRGQGVMAEDPVH